MYLSSDSILAAGAMAAAFLIAVLIILRHRGDDLPPPDDDPRYQSVLAPIERKHLARILPLEEGASCYVQIEHHGETFSTIHVHTNGEAFRYWEGGPTPIDLYATN